jgi:hypothetical protein
LVERQIWFNGKERQLSLGIYPSSSLKDVCERRDAARMLFANGIDPGENRKAQKSASTDRSVNSFEVAAREWFAKYSANSVPKHSDLITRLFDRDVFPWIGGRRIAEINTPEVLTFMRRIESRGALGTAPRALSNCGQEFR